MVGDVLIEDMLETLEDDMCRSEEVIRYDGDAVYSDPDLHPSCQAPLDRAISSYNRRITQHGRAHIVWQVCHFAAVLMWFFLLLHFIGSENLLFSVISTYGVGFMMFFFWDESRKQTLRLEEEEALLPCVWTSKSSMSITTSRRCRIN